MASEQSQPLTTPFPSTDPEIRQAVLDAHQKEGCFDKGPIKDMTFSSITPMPAYRYILETFLETRDISSKTSPFRCQSPPDAKPCPDKWSVVVPPPSAPPGKTVIDFTETSQVINCPACATTGRIVCEKCSSTGTIVCVHCEGCGIVGVHGFWRKEWKGGWGIPERTCPFCNGTTQITCDICARKGYLMCPQCDGFTRIRSYNVLTVTWATDVKTFNTPRGDIPTELLDQAQYSTMDASQSSKSGDTRPINFPADPEITDMAARYVAEMLEQKDWRVISCRQTVLEVPVVKVDFQWKDHVDSFYIYGKDKQIHFRDKYPGSTSCGCCCIA